jgi:hypothetical protein
LRRTIGAARKPAHPVDRRIPVGHHDHRDVAVPVPAGFALAQAAAELVTGGVRKAHVEQDEVGLTECTGCGCLALDRCKLTNPGDRAARLGPGPRYWIGDPPPARRPSST